MEEEFNPELSLALSPEKQKEIIAKQVCNQVISIYEIDYIDKVQPNRGLIFKAYSRPNEKGLYNRVNYLITLFQRSLEFEQDNTTFVEVIFDVIEGVRVNEISQEEARNFYPEIPETNDLLSLYNIWSNRLNCIRIDPNFAKDLTLNELKIYQNTYNEFKNKDDLVRIYSILIMNKYTFNIVDNSKITKLLNIKENIDDIKHDIEYLFESLQKRILAL